MKRLRNMIACLLLSLVLAATVAAQDEESFAWPRVMTGEKGEMVMYQPQVESFEGVKLEMRAAVSVKMAGQDEMVFGAMWLEARLETDMDTRTATLESIKVTATKFPDIEQARVDELSRFIEGDMPTWDMVVSIDRLLASLPDHGSGDDGFKAEPPVIHHHATPTVLVVIDGDPILKDLEGSDLQYVANSAFFIVTDKKNGYFLRGAGMWFVSDDIGGQWKITTDLPSQVAELSVKIDEEEEAAQAAEQAEDAEVLGLEKAEDEPAPGIIVTTVPAELIVTDGEPDFASVEGTNLLYLKNTESDVLMDISAQQYYVLISGRWFRAKSLTANDWQFVAFESLPADFAKIPANSDMATVLASVPGTDESREALLETQIPQTAEVDRKTATCEVGYDGDPEFESCADGVAYAINTDMAVLLINQKYYCVDNAVWFVSGGPEGPWSVATEVPAEVQNLPPECPVYNVKYVYIYDSTPEVVYVGYTSGYYGSYVWGSCVVYGTGWYYYPWYGYYYYPRPVTYGYAVHYSPYGGWGFAFGASYGWVHIGVSWGHPYYRGWGAAGYRYGYRRGYWRGYNHGYRHGYRRGAAAGYRAGYRQGQRQHHNNAYRNRADGVARTGDVRKRDGKRPATTPDRKNDVYTDRNGDVYRNKDGNWEKREGGDWSDRSGDAGRERDGDRTREGDSASRDRSDQASRERDQQQSRDRSDQQMQRDRSSGNQQQQLDRDRSNRDRGNQRQQQSPNRGSGSRGGGGRR